MNTRPAAFILLLILALLPFLVRSDYQASSFEDRVHAFSRPLEFDFASWTLDALWVKNEQSTADFPRYLTKDRQHELVMDYIHTLQDWEKTSAEIQQIYSNPSIHDPATIAAVQLQIQSQLQARLQILAPLAESILQHQVGSVLTEMGLTTLGQVLPPVLYHVTPLPNALIISPRSVIRQDSNISLQPVLTLDQITSLETEVERGLDVSALVVPVGGIGTYPTMVISTSDLNFLISVVAHEWTHNYLTVRPLGINYDTTPELRTMNETTASISGDEISQMVIKKYYPEMVPPPAPPAAPSTPTEQTAQPPAFDFNHEMHITRITTDALLAQGKITAAETYMEQRRQFLWDHGYQIRRLNQAYFAFYGAYAETPGGAAGEDPVGPAVRQLRQRSSSLADFLNTISEMSSFQQLENYLKSK